MLIVEAGFLVLCLEFGVIDVGKNIFELPVIGLQNSVLGGQVHRVTTQQAVAEARARKIFNGIVEVVHSHGNSPTFGIFNHSMFNRLGTVFRMESNSQTASAGNLEISSLVLVTEGVAGDHDRLCPPAH